MGIIQDRVAKIEKLITEIKNHHMCLFFIEDSTHYLIQYPEGYFPEGVRIEKGNNKIKALEKLIPKMDKHWDDSFV